MSEYWTMFGPPLVAAAAVILACFIAMWLISLAMKDSSIVDIFWGPGCAIGGWVAFFVASGGTTRTTIVLVLATLWAARIGWYIGKRNWGAEDRRYARLRKHVEDQGKSYVWYSLKHVFLYQGAMMWVASLPIMFAVIYKQPANLGPVAWLGVAAFVVGLIVETVADNQMSAFRNGPRQPGEVMDRGLWRYSRHPNYFGEMMIQWGFFLIACDQPIGLITFVGPLVLSYNIIGPLGAALLERRLLKKNPGYADYIARTSKFIPWPPKAKA